MATRGKQRRSTASSVREGRIPGRSASETSEAEFLAAYDVSQYPQVSVAVDVALLSAFDRHLHAVVGRRREHPHRDRWALPGGFVRPEESLEDAAERILASKAGIADVFVEQLYSFGEPERDPRTRVVTVAYVALIDPRRFEATTGASSPGSAELAIGRIVVPWQGETGGPIELTSVAGEPMPMAFDHADIVGMAVKRIRGKLDYTPIGFQLLPENFTLRQLQEVHETVLGVLLNKDSFRRRMLATGLLEATGRRQRAVGHRPAELYRFSKRSAV